MNTHTTCALAARWIELSMDGELAPEQESQLEEHLDRCGDCRERFERSMSERRLLEDELGRWSGEFDELLANRITEASIERFAVARAAEREREQRRGYRRTVRRAAAVFLMGSVAFGIVWGAIQLSNPGRRARAIAMATWSGPTPRFMGAEESGSSRMLNGYEPVTVPKDCTLELSYPDGSRVEVTGPSRFELQSETGRRLFRLEEGLAVFSIEHTADSYVVTTRLGGVKVIGTEFTVEHDESRNQTGVLVDRGKVQVWRRDQPRSVVTLGAGDVARIPGRQDGHGILQVFRDAATVSPAAAPVSDRESRVGDRGPGEGSRPSSVVPEADGPSTTGDSPPRPKLDMPVPGGQR
ncbi:MAG: FecR domain-containing protein [Planctomycetes bacterium]|nr:FecR domain-containing protein [Planctomycetota bacterium]